MEEKIMDTVENVEKVKDATDDFKDKFEDKNFEIHRRSLYRYLVVEYCFKDDSTNGEKHILGSYPTIGMARLNAGIYIKDNAKRMKKRYRFWQVKVQREKVFFDINMRVR